jgi:hypothetical protein
MRAIESSLHLDDLEPLEALRRLVGFTFDHHQGNQDFIRLVMAENIERGVYLSQSKGIRKLNVPAIDAVSKIYTRGLASGLFRPGLDPVDIHASITALSFYNVSNQHTFGLIFQRNMQTPKALSARRDSIIETVLRFVCV